MKKKIMIVGTALLLTAFMAACGAGAPETSAPAELPQTESTQLPTEPVATAAPTESTVVTQPVETTVTQTEATEPSWDESETVPEDTAPPVVVVPETKPAEKTEFEKYQEMTAEEQEAFYNSFETPEAFFEWYNAAKEEYEKANPPVIIDGSTNVEIKP